MKGWFAPSFGSLRSLGFVATLVAAGAVGLTRDAGASVSMAVTWEGLLHDSTAVAVVTASDAHSVWENGRIYTYTHVHVDRAVAGGLATGADALVRTMGGEVGEIGQRVEGEAVLGVGSAYLVFAHSGPSGSFVVTARGQGAFPVVASDKDAALHVMRGPSIGALIPPQPAAGATVHLAVERIPGRLVDDVARDVVADWAKLHAATP